MNLFFERIVFTSHATNTTDKWEDVSSKAAS